MLLSLGDPQPLHLTMMSDLDTGFYLFHISSTKVLWVYQVMSLWKLQRWPSLAALVVLFLLQINRLCTHTCISYRGFRKFVEILHYLFIYLREKFIPQMPTTLGDGNSEIWKWELSLSLSLGWKDHHYLPVSTLAENESGTRMRCWLRKSSMGLGFLNQ